jgi:hypothetical protein
MRLNGWQRLWLVGTVCLGLWLIGWWPLQLIGAERDSSSWYDRQAIERDFSNPLCRAYQVGPISALSEPPADNYGGTCWHIYKSRQSQKNAEVPYTLETYDRQRSPWWLKPYFAALALGALATGILSALVYLCGLVVGWIFQGFRRA